jgi:hypothetical protein
LGAYWKHEYKKWDVKAQASQAQSENSAHHDRQLSANFLQEAVARSKRADRLLAMMRWAMLGATVAIIAAVLEPVGAIWLNYLGCLG